MKQKINFLFFNEKQSNGRRPPQGGWCRESGFLNKKNKNHYRNTFVRVFE